MAELKDTPAEPNDIRALESSIESSKDASSLAPNNDETEANEAENDDDDDELVDWSSSDENDLPVVNNPVDPRHIKVRQPSTIS